MPKQKTHKGASKRFRKTKTGKIIHRTAGQGHFNSRENGKVTTNKRSDSSLASVNESKIKALIPHK